MPSHLFPLPGGDGTSPPSPKETGVVSRTVVDGGEPGLETADLFPLPVSLLEIIKVIAESIANNPALPTDLRTFMGVVLRLLESLGVESSTVDSFPVVDAASDVELPVGIMGLSGQGLSETQRTDLMALATRECHAKTHEVAGQQAQTDDDAPTASDCVQAFQVMLGLAEEWVKA